MKHKTTVAMVVAALFLLTVGAPHASADILLYCVGGSSTGCSATAPVTGNYWTANISMTTTSNTLAVYRRQSRNARRRGRRSICLTRFRVT